MKVFILLVSIMLVLVACGQNNSSITEPYEEEHTLPQQILTTTTTPQRELLGNPHVRPQGQLEDFSSDGILLVERLEAIHPNFFLDGRLPANYEATREWYLATISQPMTHTDFVMATQRFLAIHGDGHLSRTMQVYSADGERGLFQDGQFIEAEFIANEQGVFLENSQVLSIGGVYAEEILELIDMYYGAYNEFGTFRNHARYSRSELILYMVGAQIYERDSRLWVELVLYEDGNMASRVVSFSQHNPSSHLPMSNTYELIGNVMYISMVGPQLSGGLYIDEVHNRFRWRETAELEIAIERAIDDGIREFILDIRDMPGGLTEVFRGLYTAMGLTLPWTGEIVGVSEMDYSLLDALLSMPRFSHLEISDVIDRGYKYSIPSTETANLYDVTVAVLTSNRTFSAGVYAASIIADSGFGIVVGEPSATSPSGYGLGYELVLPTSNLVVRITTSLFFRPDVNADQRVLWPDIIVNEQEALNVALHYLQLN